MIKTTFWSYGFKVSDEVCLESLLTSKEHPSPLFSDFEKMVNPAIDERKPFSYLAKPTTTLSMIGANQATQVTFDGALSTPEAELFFFFGTQHTPILARNRVFDDGWIPIVKYNQRMKDIDYQVEAFLFSLNGNPCGRLINFVKICAINRGFEAKEAAMGAGIRYSGVDHRFIPWQPGPFNPEWNWEMKERMLLRNNKLVLLYPESALLEATWSVPYDGPFFGTRYQLSERSATGVFKFLRTLQPGESYTEHFMFPIDPIPADEIELIGTLIQADYEDYRERVKKYWQEIMKTGTELFIPEKKVMDTWRAGLMYDWQAIWTNRKGKMTQGVNMLQYKNFYLRDAADILHNYDLWGFSELSRKLIDVYPDYQNISGNFSSQSEELDGFGQAVYTFAMHTLITADKDYGHKIWPLIPPAINWFKKARQQDPLHLMPSTEVLDGEFIQGHYTGHNFWALLGLRTAIRLAQFLGKEKERQEWRAEYQDYLQVFLSLLEEAYAKTGYIPPGLENQGGQDSGNLLGGWPAEVLEPHDEKLSATLERIHRTKFLEGCMSYMGHVHQYYTVKVTQNNVIRDEQEQVLRDFYSILVHTGSAGECFEWQVAPWAERDSRWNFPPHGWGSTMLNLLLRNMLIQERGGNGGLDGRELHLCPVLSPEWVKPGKEIRLRNARTELGRVTFRYLFSEKGASMEYEADYHRAPSVVVLHLPWFIKLQTYCCDTEKSKLDGNTILIYGPFRWIHLQWEYDSSIPLLNYETFVNNYCTEYSNKYQRFIMEGKQGLEVIPPPIQPETLSKKKTNPLDIERKILEIDLGEVEPVSQIGIYPYWYKSREYPFRLWIMNDDDEWELLTDSRMDKNPVGPEGKSHIFSSPRKIRFIRVELYWNDSQGTHLVDVRVISRV